MNIQIIGKTKCFDTKKAERFFKERKIKFQYIDILKYGMSRGEFESVVKAVGFEALFDSSAPGAEEISYLTHQGDKLDKLFENQRLVKTPVVRNGKLATVGYASDVWSKWE